MAVSVLLIRHSSTRVRLQTWLLASNVNVDVSIAINVSRYSEGELDAKLRKKLALNSVCSIV